MNLSHVLLTNANLYVEPYSSVLNGLAWGASIRHLPLIWDAMQRAGMLHILVLSGANITLLVIFLHRLLFFLTIKVRMLFIIFAIFSFVAFCGFSPSLVRAALFGIISSIGVLFGKKTYPAYILAFTFVLVLLFQSEWLSNVSFQLSFGASLGMVLFTNDIKLFLDKYFFGYLSKELAVSIGAQLGVTPFLLYYFGTLSIFAPITSILIFWIIVPLTISSMIVTFFYLFVGYPISTLIALNVYGVKYLLFIANYFSHFSWSMVSFGF